MDYKSNEERSASASSEALELTASEVEVLRALVRRWTRPLEGVVTAAQIERKVISLDFDAEAVERWAQSLVQVDTRVKGVKEFEWNDTETKGEKVQKRK